MTLDTLYQKLCEIGYPFNLASFQDAFLSYNKANPDTKYCFEVRVSMKDSPENLDMNDLTIPNTLIYEINVFIDPIHNNSPITTAPLGIRTVSDCDVIIFKSRYSLEQITQGSVYVEPSSPNAPSSGDVIAVFQELITSRADNAILADSEVEFLRSYFEMKEL